MSNRSPITTHVLDVSLGKAAPQIPVVLEKLSATGQWGKLGEGKTDTDGRVEELLPSDAKIELGIYRLVFNTQVYFGEKGTESFYPYVSVSFQITQPDQHHHVPLLLSPFSYSTYRGT
jgi:5-hydroxyisourate hydrolase